MSYYSDKTKTTVFNKQSAVRACCTTSYAPASQPCATSRPRTNSARRRARDLTPCDLALAKHSAGHDHEKMTGMVLRVWSSASGPSARESSSIRGVIKHDMETPKKCVDY